MEPTPITITTAAVEFVRNMPFTTGELSAAMHLLSMERTVKELEQAGFAARVVNIAEDPGRAAYLNLVLVYAPEGADSNRNEWVDAFQARRLLDTAANLPPAEAFDRWAQGLPLPKPYTLADAKDDMWADRHAARRRYESGQDDAETYRLTVRSSGLSMEGVEPADRNEHLRTIPQLALLWEVSPRRAQAHVKRLHATRGVGRKLGNIWVLTEEEAAANAPGEPGRPAKVGD